MPARALTTWSLVVAAALSVAILLAAFLAALVIAQRRRIAAEREHVQRILAAQEEERSRVARELHDDALQRIAVIRHELDEVARLAGPAAARRAAGVAGELEDLGAVLRSAAHQLHPSVVEKAGLVRALAALATEFGRTAGLNVRLALPPGDVSAGPAVAVAAYRIAQEALRNVARHAGVASAELTLELRDGALLMRVTDAGKGFDPELGRPAGSLGLVAMSQRAEAAGGRVSVTPRPGGGTVVSAVFPAGAGGAR
jgi:signal transduction histidine kinase